MKAVILAGGEGSRLKGISRNIPKPMLSIAGAPILEHQVNLLKRYGITDILMILGHLSEVVEGHFGDGGRFDVRISYHREDKPLGTTGGVKECESLLTEDFLMLYGDVILDMDLDRLVRFHREKNGDGTLVLHPNDHPYDSDLVEIDENNRIIAFYSKPHPDGRYFRNLVNAAVYVFSPTILDELTPGVKADFGKDIFPNILQKRRLYGYESPEYIKDMGTSERLSATERDLIAGKVARLNRQFKRAAIFIDRDGVINRHVGLLAREEDLELIPGVAEAIGKINASEFLAVVVTNQSVVARNLCSMEDVREIHRKMETLLGDEGAYLNGIYFCPHHPDKGYPEENPAYKITCNCRKPAIGMLEAAVADLGIDLATSCMIGDTSRDVQTARNAGIRAFVVHSGDDYGDASITPDGSFDDLQQAVNCILSESHRTDQAASEKRSG
jgi:histidinol-phosphate phosphatase family protein